MEKLQIHGVFATRETINDAMHYALDVAESTPDGKAAVITSVYVLYNTMAAQINKLIDQAGTNVHDNNIKMLDALNNALEEAEDHIYEAKAISERFSASLVRPELSK